MPTRETGATTASSLAGGCARPLIRGATLPGEVERAPGEVGEIRRDREERHRGQNRRHLRVPLEHLTSPLRWVPQTHRIVCRPAGGGHHPNGVRPPLLLRKSLDRGTPLYPFRVHPETDPPQPSEVDEAIA